MSVVGVQLLKVKCLFCQVFSKYILKALLFQIDNQSSDLLSWAPVVVKSNQGCNVDFTRLQITKDLTNEMICTIGGIQFSPTKKVDRGVCGRDIGGPLVCLENGIPKLTGVIEYSKGCGDVKHPSVHKKVSAFIDWIQHSIVRLHHALNFDFDS